MSRQLYNFAQKRLKVNIRTDSLSVDGCEVENLVENNLKLNFFQNKHFMAEYYVKCPVTVCLCFPCLVDISAVIIGPRVSSIHSTKCFELYAAYQQPITKPMVGALLPCEYPVDLSVQPTHTLFNLVGKYNERFNISNGESIIFKNYQHPIVYQSEMYKDGETVSMKPIISTRSCSHLLIKITFATVPVIKFLEVWGTISTRNPPILLRAATTMISSIALNSKENLVRKEEEVKNKKKSVLENPSKCKMNCDDIQTPDEFLDPITYDIMTFPLLLPSGNNIDKTTYDKFVSEEDKLGRVPCDPFTGVAFHHTKQPVPNMTLKSRIDQFLIKHPDVQSISCNVIGTKGGANSVLGKTRSNIVMKVDSSTLTKSNAHDSCKRKTEMDEIICDKKIKRGQTMCHQSELNDSLHDALSRTIHYLPLSNSVAKQEETIKCEKCFVNDKNILYKLPCSHCYCKTCISSLLNNNNKKCNRCNCFFEKLDVIKVR